MHNECGQAIPPRTTRQQKILLFHKKHSIHAAFNRDGKKKTTVPYCPSVPIID